MNCSINAWQSRICFWHSSAVTRSIVSRVWTAQAWAVLVRVDYRATHTLVKTQIISMRCRLLT
jgi:hypothetical protein